ncbi:unnamed protein product [Prunus armeniaca]|uniref:Uncharacterized protein n=1 Tax=Prunus armeniaca TaxID=36596 RepID=A0A6J5TRZ2_PRUAR|nr:unnamed protein product [Prunus armeniaca]
MATLARSASTFRRQGSSGLIWDDNLMLQREEGRAEFRELRPCQSAKPIGPKAYSSSNGALAICPRSSSTSAKKNPHSLKSKFLKMFRALFRK